MKATIKLNSQTGPDIEFEFDRGFISLRQGNDCDDSIDYIEMDLYGLQQLVELVELAKRNLDL